MPTWLLKLLKAIISILHLKILYKHSAPHQKSLVFCSIRMILTQVFLLLCANFAVVSAWTTFKFNTKYGNLTSDLSGGSYGFDAWLYQDITNVFVRNTIY